MGVAKHFFLQFTGSDGTPITTCAIKKLKTISAKEKVDTAGATTKMVNFSAKFIMRNSDPKEHLFFTLDCNGYNIWLDHISSGKVDLDDHKQIRKFFPWSYH